MKYINASCGQSAELFYEVNVVGGGTYTNNFSDKALNQD
jgi:hypothetical protein